MSFVLIVSSEVSIILLEVRFYPYFGTLINTQQLDQSFAAGVHGVSNRCQQEALE